jgi:hypothetical protein
MIKTKEGAKHLAQTLRMFGVAQFVHYGVENLDKIFTDKNSAIVLIASACAFGVSEYLGFKIIDKKD